MTKKQEHGAIMLEVLAVLALIGVMGPMLYKQVLSRNQEISNVNIAAEMRAIKEAMSAAIAADSAILGGMCGKNTSLTLCETGSTYLHNTVVDFLPIGMESILNDGYYIIKLYSEDVTLLNGDTYPLLVGIVAGTDLASDWNFKRTARIANLIGTDGGIAQGCALVGAGGSWQLGDSEDCKIDIVSQLEDALDVDEGAHIVVATTAMDTFDPDLGATEPNAVAVPGSLAFNKLHAWNYFSVGTSVEGKKCFKTGRTVNEDDTGTGDVVNTDAIKHAGERIEGNICDPLFWVGTKGEAGDNSIAGQVYVKNNLYVGRDNEGKKQAFAFEAEGSKDHDGDTVDNSRIVVYNIAGNDTLTIDAKGKIVSDKTMNIGGTQNADGTYEGGTNYNYGLDVANTSVLNDIRLASRGGARLSDILPNYISKGMYQISSSTYPVSYTVPKPACPENYAAAVIVTPLKWGMPKAADIQLPEVTAAHSLSVSGTSVEGYIEVPEQTILADNIIVSRHNFAIEINPAKSDDRVIGTSDWTVKLGYKANSDDDEFQTLSDFEDGEIQALAQTYCVYAPSDTTYDPNALTDETKIPDSLKK